jgi:putative membrane protein
MHSPFSSNPKLQAIVAWLALFWIVTAVNPLHPDDWLLENLLVFLAAIVLVVSYRWFQFSNLSYAMFAAFLSLHLAGAHYTYSETPLGFWLQDWFGLQRNHYDRIVHLSFGLLLAFPLREELLRQPRVKRSWSYFLAVAMVLALSAIYEVIEGAAALTINPELGTAFLGTQGDEWDSQKDTFLAFLGAVIAMALTYIWVKLKGPIIK